MLDVLDKELERRGHHFVRYADDCKSASPALPAASAGVRFVSIDQMMKAGPDGRLP
jgi:hypothetical protein